MKNKITCAVSGAVLLALSLLCFFLPKDDFSESERRVLAAFPEVSADSIFSGEFASGFEEYAVDTFPFRDSFRTIKAYTSSYLFNLSDNNGIFFQNGHLSKIEYPMNTPMLDHAAGRFEFIYDTYLRGSGANVYFSVIPDKSFFLDTLKLDYSELIAYTREKTPFMEYIDIFPYLELSDYYTTDSHWRQERILDAADAIAGHMGADISAEYTENTHSLPFYGVYSGQSAMKVAPDTIKYLTNEILSSCIVKRVNDTTGMLEPAELYDMKKASGRDPYEMYLSGNSAVVTIENPSAKNERELVVFRDSFGSSLVPLLCAGYSKITVADIRYVQSAMLGSFIDFDGSDVLFLYSTTLLNNSLAMK